MKAIISGMPEMDEQDQQLIGRDILILCYYQGFPVDGLHVKFEDEE